MSADQWGPKALCRDNPDLFITPLRRLNPLPRAQALADVAKAQEICSRCPVRSDCYAQPKGLKAGGICHGVPHDEHGDPVPFCSQCGAVVVCRSAGSQECSDRCGDRAYAARHKTAVAA